MELQLGTWLLPWGSWKIDEALGAVKECGLDLVCLYPTQGGEKLFDDESSAADTAKLQAKLDEYGVRCGCLYAANPASSSVDAAKKRIDMCVALGGTHMISGGTWGYDSWPDGHKAPHVLDAMHQVFVEQHQEIAKHCESVGITFCVKPHTGNTATWPLLKKTVDAVGSPAFRACIDLGNVAFYEGVNPSENLDMVTPLTSMVALKDHSGPRANGNFPILGDGSCDHIWLFQKLKEANFSGPMYIERFGGAPSLAEANERCKLSITNIKRMFAAATAD